MKKWLSLLVALTAVFVLLADFGGKDSIVICSSAEQFRNDAMQEQLNQRFPDYHIMVSYMPTGKAASKIYAEGPGSEVDILAAMETGYLNKLRNCLEDISGLSQIPYMEGLEPKDNDNLWVCWERQAGAIVINTEVLEKHGLEKPTGYQDLLKPEYKELIAMPDPKSSGTGYFFYKTWVNTMGEQAALDYVDQLYRNLKQFTESGSGPIKLLKQGEVGIGLALTFQAVKEINDGQPLEIIFPEQGSPYSLTGIGVLKGHLKKPGVAEVYDFLIHEFLIYDKENFSPEIIYDGQQNLIPNYPQDIFYADMAGIQDQAEKERLLKLWKY